MATGYITKRAVDALKSDSRQLFFWDAGDGAIKGFGVRVTPAGVKSYVYQYRLGGRGAAVRRYTIGRHGEFTPDSARARAIELAEQVRRNIDPLDAEAGQRKDRDEKAQRPAIWLLQPMPPASLICTSSRTRQTASAFRNRFCVCMFRPC